LNFDNEREIILNAIKEYSFNLCQDVYGAHVIEKIIETFTEQQITFLYDTILFNFSELANHNNGLCVVKKMIINIISKEYLNKTKEILNENLFNLVQNPYGNYAIQTAFEYWQEEDVLPILNKFKNKYVNLSMQKYSSNVVEKCLERSDQIALKTFAEEVSQMSRSSDLMKNNYGNYVIQKALKLARGETKVVLLKSIAKNVDRIGDKKLIQKWRGIVNSHCNILNMSYNNIFNDVNMMNSTNNFISHTNSETTVNISTDVENISPLKEGRF
jgi:hypothetical protein